MNDNDIIKALELCLTPKGTTETCGKCPYHKHGKLCTVERDTDAYDLINRQKAEIARLNCIRAELSKKIDKLKHEMSYMKKPNTIGDTHEMGAW